MAFNYEYANVFSNILAQENIFISFDASLKTACFNLKTRVLSLPHWDGSRELQRFLLCHEVSHAIFTPCDGWLNAIEARPKEHQRVYLDVLNVFEDARVDRLMTQKYIGMRRWYAEGIDELTNKFDLWELANDPAKAHDMSLIDRINLFFKTSFISNPFGLSFPSPEDTWISRTNAARTFQQVKKVADDFFDQMDKDEKESQTQVVISLGIFTVEGATVATQEAIQKVLDELVGRMPFSPKTHSNHVNSLVLPDSDYKPMLVHLSGDLRENERPTPDRNLINKMASVFQRKKNAMLYSRVQTNKTGIIDPLKLYSYSYNEDIMLRKTIIDKQKNHGFIMIVDTSSSMTSVWSSVVDHLFILAMFCKQIGVPFESYGFTKGYQPCAITNTMFGLVPLISSDKSTSYIIDIIGKIKNLQLCGFTPLTSSVHYAKTLSLDFIAKHRIDVMNIIFLTDGGCTSTITSNCYTDARSRYMTSHCKDFKGGETGVGPLMKILRHRTNANVWSYYISGNNSDYMFTKEIGGATGLFDIGKNTLKENPSIFIEDLIAKMSVFGGLIDS